MTLSRTEDNFFVSAGDVSFPLPDTIDIRVVAIDGQTVDDQVRTQVNMNVDTMN